MTALDDSSQQPDDRPPICPACGVTNFLALRDDEVTFVCVECGFSDD